MKNITPVYHWDVHQNTPEWEALRCGKITASQVSDFVTAKTLKLSDSQGSWTASYRVAGERLTGRPKDTPETYAMRWGHNHEPVALDVLATLTEAEIITCGFVSLDGRNIGFSPDGLIGDDTTIEVKCPQHVENHLRTADIAAVPPEYWLQVLMGLWVTGRKHCLFVSYHPWIHDLHLACVVVPVSRDDPVVEHQITKLGDAVVSADCRVSDLITERFGGTNE